MRVLCLCLALATPARAEVNFNRDKHAREDLALISTCFDAAQTWEAAQDCVNLTFEGCIGRFGKSASHADEGGCNHRELELWEHLLAIETRKVEAWAVLKDNDIAVAGYREAHAHESFLASLERWEAYRQAQCEFAVRQAAGGGSGGTIRLHCQMDLVVERLFTLRPLFARIEGDAQP
jgi:uncharacterized protein YecT (DUF1311 family)